ncbi:uncharacterized protein JN550_010014 [Neoarthrinium moseri]|uniref:uncharacterized protein n=1 Tax=Neoarthrinium moseri TaxID=1658444 RepID=UPI001FDCCDF3|nr:uncharacterized protein JN550_010014 [Neoarthrinium moseri]KAI1862677.1 hypothetical protein JN550_010014 [Neoarthrinium moseri]
MAPVTFHETTIGTFSKILAVLLRILDAASPHPDVDSFLDLRLTPDMLPLGAQARIVTVAPINLVERLTGKQLVTWNEKRTMWGEQEKVWSELIARVKMTLEILKAVDLVEVEAKADKTKLSLIVGPEDAGASSFMEVPAIDCMLANGLPNTYFHLYMVYSLLRSNGVDIGKRDVLIPFLPSYILEGYQEP